MSNFIFRNKSNIETILINDLGTNLIISKSNDIIKFFQNGDNLTVNTKTGEVEYDPICPGTIFTSKISLRINQWFAKGIIKSIN